VVVKRSKASGGSNGPTTSKKISEESKNEYSRSKKSSSDHNSNVSGEPFKSPFMIIRQSKLEKIKSNMTEAIDLILSEG
jgi:hypothetical protein